MAGMGPKKGGAVPFGLGYGFGGAASRLRRSLAAHTETEDVDDVAALVELPRIEDDPEAHFLWFKHEHGDLFPSPKQADFLSFMDPSIQERRHCGYGGAVGGGKSVICSTNWFDYALSYPGSVALAGRQNLIDFTSTVTQQFLIPGCEYLQEVFGLRWDYYAQQGRLVLYNGAEGKMGSVLYIKPMSNPDKIKGDNIDFLWLEESSEIPLTVVSACLHRLRGSVRNPFVASSLGWPLRFQWNSNPGPGWAKTWADADGRGEMGSGQWKGCRFIRALWCDNPKNPADYAEVSLATDPSERNRNMLEGNWGSLPGQVFKHDIFGAGGIAQVFDPMKICGKPVGAVLEYGGYDFGVTHPSVALRAFIAPFEIDGVLKPRLFIWDMFCRTEMPIPEQIEWMNEYPNVVYFADRSIFYQMSTMAGAADHQIAEDFSVGGVSMVPANEGGLKWSIKNGIWILDKLFRNRQILIHEENCPELLDAVVVFSRQPDPARPGEFMEDKFLADGKDKIDALRYLAINVAEELDWSERIGETVPGSIADRLGGRGVPRNRVQQGEEEMLFSGYKIGPMGRVQRRGSHK